jgi:hypothetical protein
MYTRAQPVYTRAKALSRGGDQDASSTLWVLTLDILRKIRSDNPDDRQAGDVLILTNNKLVSVKKTNVWSVQTRNSENNDNMGR